LGREDAVGEIWDASEHGRTEDDTANDFSDDFGLFDQAEEPAKSLGENNDEDELDDE
jgi:hypothetical protein